MARIVLKFGGTSVGDTDRLKNVARKVKAEVVRGNEVVWEGLTRPQLFLALTIPFVVLRIVLRARSGASAPDRQVTVGQVHR